MNREEFIIEVEELGIKVSEDKLDKLNRYYELLVEWNKRINLTAITAKEEVYLKHFYDSLTLYKAIDLNNEIKVCDVGTGAGFPGIVLKIFFPNIDITLVDALNKRIKFLNIVIEELNLKKIKTIHSRIEDFSKQNIENYDLVTCRAVSKLNILNELTIPMIKVNGLFIPMKAKIDDEIKEANNSLIKLDCKMDKIITFTLPKEDSIRNLVVIKKLKSTDKKYPRKFDKITKNPL